jgi:hypothetical protein
MLPARHSFVTVAWITLNLLPLCALFLLWSALWSWSWGLLVLLFVLYLLLFVPYGFFVAMPLMVKLFRPPSSTHKQRL